MTGYTEQERAAIALRRLDARKAAIDERAAAVRARLLPPDYPLRGDYANRAAYRAAVARFGRK